MYNRHIKEAIKHMELIQEQLESLESQNEKLKEQLNTAIVLLCSNKAKVVQQVEVVYDRGDRYGKEIDSVTTYSLFVESLNTSGDSGTFSPEASPYQAVLTGIEEYIEYMADNE
jgi:anion-transporting  ArsA/GET3 family ATPase